MATQGLGATGSDFNQVTGGVQGTPGSGPTSLTGVLSNLPSAIQGVINPLRAATQRTIDYNTSEGFQAANSAGTEYANRAAQSGGSALGAGVARAQSLLPVFQQNATARQQEANTEAGYKMQGLSLQGQLASSLGQMRNQYASTLANYMTQQRSQNISLYGDQINAANSLLNQKMPFATTNKPLGAENALGQFTGGNPDLNYYNAQMGQRANAQNFLSSGLGGPASLASSTPFNMQNAKVPSWLQVNF